MQPILGFGTTALSPLDIRRTNPAHIAPRPHLFPTCFLDGIGIPFSILISSSLILVRKTSRSDTPDAHFAFRLTPFLGLSNSVAANTSEAAEGHLDEIRLPH